MSTISWSSAASIAIVAILGVACDESGQPNYEFVPEMVDSVPYDPLNANPVTRDGRTFQSAPVGTIARAATPFAYGAGPAEAQRAAKELASPILSSTPAVIARGEKIFLRVCASCHGAKGQGDGPIVPRFPAPPPLDAPHARALSDGQLFHILMRGQGVMPAHGAQVSPADRWSVVAFIRSLQPTADGGVK